MSFVLINFVAVYILIQNEVEPKMDEAEDDCTAEFCDPKETTVEERRFIPEKVFYATDTGNSGNSERQSITIHQSQFLL